MYGQQDFGFPAKEDLATGGGLCSSEKTDEMRIERIALLERWFA
jgi:hypothetical protein